MKISNKIMILLLSALLPMGFAGCSDDDNEMPVAEVPDFVLGQEILKVKIGAENKVTLTVEKGGGDYDAFVLDGRVAKATLTDGKIEVEGFANGQTTLIVSDKYNRYRRMPLSVYTTDVLQLSHESFDFVAPLGNSKTLKANVVLGNGGYEVTSDNSSVKVTIDEAGEISMTATSKKVEYLANVTVSDRTGLTATIKVKVISSLIPFSEEDLTKIMADATRRYYYGTSLTSQSYFTFLNQVLTNGKQRFGWNYYNSYWFYLDFFGGKSVGTKSEAVFVYRRSAININVPITLEIIKNDGTNIWGVFSYINEEEEKLHTGYFCDAVGN